MYAFSTQILESLAGTEIPPNSFKTAQTREELARCIHYRMTSGNLSDRPPVRMELLINILSPWASISHGGCRYLRRARAEALRKF